MCAHGPSLANCEALVQPLQRLSDLRLHMPEQLRQQGLGRPHPQFVKAPLLSGWKVAETLCCILQLHEALAQLHDLPRRVAVDATHVALQDGVKLGPLAHATQHLMRILHVVNALCGACQQVREIAMHLCPVFGAEVTPVDDLRLAVQPMANREPSCTVDGLGLLLEKGMMLKW